jgi:hypothetical protein
VNSAPGYLPPAEFNARYRRPAPSVAPDRANAPSDKTHEPSTAPILTAHETAWLASTDAQVIAARAREDADAGRPMLAPVDLDEHRPDTTEVDLKWAAVNDRIGGRR